MKYQTNNEKDYKVPFLLFLLGNLTWFVLLVILHVKALPTPIDNPPLQSVYAYDVATISVYLWVLIGLPLFLLGVWTMRVDKENWNVLIRKRHVYYACIPFGLLIMYVIMAFS